MVQASAGSQLTLALMINSIEILHIKFASQVPISFSDMLFARGGDFRA
jgi:hypothetical protein